MWKIGLTNYFTSVKYVKGLFIIKIIIIQKRIMAKPRIKIDHCRSRQLRQRFGSGYLLVIKMLKMIERVSSWIDA